MAAKQSIYGWHTVAHVLRQRPEHVLGISLQRGRDDTRAREVLELARIAGVHVEETDGAALERRVGQVAHQGVVATVRERPECREDELPELLAAAAAPRLVLVLDGVQDPHNLGACLRVADGAGVCAVVVPKRRAVGLTETVRKVASGAAETVPLVRVTNLARALDGLRDAGLRLVGTAGGADSSLYDADLSGDLAVVMGGEARGLRRLTAERCDALVSLPMAGAVESLNVSVATGICLYEARRQHCCAAAAL